MAPVSEKEVAVLQANATFYRAFTRGDFAAMSELWARRVVVACIHPSAPALLGRAAVLESWRQILREPPPFEMRCDHARVSWLVDVALVTCYEGNADAPAHLVATNLFVSEEGRWRMVHHHAGPLATPLPKPVPRSTVN
jgi:ketosteroid isomerase-like protein